MAKVLGQSGRYVSQQAIKRFRQMFIVIVVTTTLIGIITGFALALCFYRGKLSPSVSLILCVALLAIEIVIWKWTDRKIGVLETQRINMRRGAAGEVSVAITLAEFPDDFRVINDLKTDFGNLDHVVVGATGVFLIDTKNWRGVVSADGKGELLINGEPTDKPCIKPFVSRVMMIKEKVAVLAPGIDSYFQAVFAFTSAHVNAKWGKTGSVHCVRDDGLFDYIVEKDFGKKLTSQQVEQMAQAFLSLAKMDADFAANSNHSTIQRT